MVRNVHQRLVRYLHKYHKDKDPERRDETSSSSIPVNYLKEENKTPLAVGILERLDSIDPQLQSPIFDKLPREVREMIWRLCLTRYEDPDNLYLINERFARPGHAAPHCIAVELLRTCRAIYIETFLTPFQINPIIVFDGENRDLPQANLLTRMASTDSPLFCRKLKFWQFANISSVEMTVQQINLEGASLERVSRVVGTLGRHKGYESRGYSPQGYASFVEPAKSVNDSGSQPSPLPNPLIGRKITHLTVRMSRTDWWSWSSSPDPNFAINPASRLRLEPMINVTHLASKPQNFLAMERGYEARIAGNEPDFDLDDFEKQGRWGLQIQEYWPDLTTFVLVLETFACKYEQLENVAKCAKLWKFPVEPGFQLVWNGKDEVGRWQGAQSYEYEPQRPSRSWFNEKGRFEASDTEVPPLIQWRPTGADESSPPNAREFVIRTMTYERVRVRDEDIPAPSRPWEL